jgi:hypothetical protein
MNIQKIAKIYNEQEDLNRIAQSIYSSLSPREKIDIQDQMLFESIEIEKFYRKNKRSCDRINSIILVKKYGNKSLVREAIIPDMAWYTEAGIDAFLAAAPVAGATVGSVIPGVGTAAGAIAGQVISGAGAIYYLVRAVDAYNKGQLLTCFFEILGCAGAAAALYPGQGTSVGLIFAGAKAALKKVFSSKVFKSIANLFKGKPSPSPVSPGTVSKAREIINKTKEWFVDLYEKIMKSDEVIKELDNIKQGTSAKLDEAIESAEEVSKNLEGTIEVLEAGTDAEKKLKALENSEKIARTAEYVGDTATAATLRTAGVASGKIVAKNVDEAAQMVFKSLDNLSTDMINIVKSHIRGNKVSIKTKLKTLFETDAVRKKIVEYARKIAKEGPPGAEKDICAQISQGMTSTSSIDIVQILISSGTQGILISVHIRVTPPGGRPIKLTNTRLANILGDSFYDLLKEIIPTDKLAEKAVQAINAFNYTGIEVHKMEYAVATAKALKNAVQEAMKDFVLQYTTGNRKKNFFTLIFARILTYAVESKDGTHGSRYDKRATKTDSPLLSPEDRMDENIYLEKLILISESRKRKIRSQKLIDLIKEDNEEFTYRDDDRSFLGSVQSGLTQGASEEAAKKGAEKSIKKLFKKYGIKAIPGVGSLAAAISAIAEGTLFLKDLNKFSQEIQRVTNFDLQGPTSFLGEYTLVDASAEDLNNIAYALENSDISKEEALMLYDMYNSAITRFKYFIVDVCFALKELSAAISLGVALSVSILPVETAFKYLLFSAHELINNVKESSPDSINILFDLVGNFSHALPVIGFLLDNERVVAFSRIDDAMSTLAEKNTQDIAMDNVYTTSRSGKRFYDIAGRAGEEIANNLKHIKFENNVSMERLQKLSGIS